MTFNISSTEGRLKDVHERRPKLVINCYLQQFIFTWTSLLQPTLSLQSTLNAASSVKKWIPSIKNEIEYYLQVGEMDFTEMVHNDTEFPSFPCV